ncbi:FAD-dependent oxidoreductase (plasmid) [Haloarcula salina]|uniref:FAD-dependent oxidoreductase n=1 Tax=Haloarcula salina TaxID=1429914 RepID=UPI003C6F0A00
MSDRDVRTDVTVVGGGMAGLTAALTAQERGVDVTLLEKGSRFGGSMYLSTGAIWTYDSYAEFRDHVPNGDPALQRLIFESIDDGYEWLEGLGVELTEPDLDLPGSGRQVDPPRLTERLTEHFEREGGRALLETPMSEIRFDGVRITGVLAHTPEDEALDIDCESVVLATGGFQGNEELVERYITPNTENLCLRANPWSTGDGFEAATAIGAKTTKGLSKFYGHSLPAPPAEFSRDELSDVSQYYGTVAVVLNRDGLRFTDEAESELEAVLIQDIVAETDGRAYYVVDSDLCDPDAVGLSADAMADIRNAEAAGGKVAECQSLEALGTALGEWGVNGETAVETIREYNAAIRDERAEQLVPPRTDHKCQLDTPPFYAVEIQPGITYTMGGIDVDTDMRVQRRSASTATYGQEYQPTESRDIETRPIPGLYAAGIDVGNVHHRTSAGGLSHGLVTGRVAGDRAATFAQGQPVVQ